MKIGDQSWREKVQEAQAALSMSSQAPGRTVRVRLDVEVQAFQPAITDDEIVSALHVVLRHAMPQEMIARIEGYQPKGSEW